MSGKLLIVSHTPHYCKTDGTLVGWAPTVRENDYLSTLFKSTEVIGVFHEEPAPASTRPYTKSSITFTALPQVGGQKLKAKFGLLRSIPKMLSILNHAIRSLDEDDVIYVRSPCHIALLACLRLSLSDKPKRWFKYAGNWNPHRDVSWSYRFQRFWLRKNLSFAKVTVNGVPGDEQGHIIPVLNPCLAESELVKAKEISQHKPPLDSLALLFVGNMIENKGLSQLLEITDSLKQRDIQFRLTAIGEGPDLESFRKRILEKGLSNLIHTPGAQNQEQVFEAYAQHHFLLLPSHSEGWPKVVSEAMAHRCVPLVSDVSCLKAILESWHAGYAIERNNIQHWSNAIIELRQKDRWHQCAEAGMAKASAFTYEKMLETVQTKILDHESA